jgi:hypothetical protein
MLEPGKEFNSVSSMNGHMGIIMKRGQDVGPVLKFIIQLCSQFLLTALQCAKCFYISI